ncbi:MAG: hypothetical protein ACE37B_08370 [Ilumatobacter sp.]|jgi:hypothetical protein|uniref:hypothetical protein n=1 Tax=Ilumatobacter sp. TaxID=1967498 RepID=UPI003919C941
MYAHFTPAMTLTIRRQHGIVSGRALRAELAEPDGLDRLHARGGVISLGADLYRVEGHPDSFAGRCVAACLHDRRVVIAGAAAASLWGIDLVYRPSCPDMTSIDGTADVDRLPRSTVRAARALHRDDIVERPDTIRLTTVARTWYDCVGQTSMERGIELTELLLADHGDVADLWAVVDRVEATRRGPKGRGYVLLDRVAPRRQAVSRAGASRASAA